MTGIEILREVASIGSAIKNCLFPKSFAGCCYLKQHSLEESELPPDDRRSDKLKSVPQFVSFLF